MCGKCKSPSDRRTMHFDGMRGDDEQGTGEIDRPFRTYDRARREDLRLAAVVPFPSSGGALPREGYAPIGAASPSHNMQPAEPALEPVEAPHEPPELPEPIQRLLARLVAGEDVSPSEGWRALAPVIVDGVAGYLERRERGARRRPIGRVGAGGARMPSSSAARVAHDLAHVHMEGIDVQRQLTMQMMLQAMSDGMPAREMTEKRIGEFWAAAGHLRKLHTDATRPALEEIDRTRDGAPDCVCHGHGGAEAEDDGAAEVDE